MRLFAAILLGLALVGCAAEEQATDGTPTLQRATDLITSDGPPADAVTQTLFGLIVYDVTATAGELSNNPAFWKRLDESANVVDPATYDLLYKNGFRVAVGSMREFDHVRSYVDDPDARQVSISDLEDRFTYLVMKPDVREQLIFYYDDTNQVHGKSFGPSENRMHVGFRRTPRVDDTLRISVTPGIMAQMADLRISALGNERQEPIEDEAMFHDVNLRADVPVGSFLVLAPSEESDIEATLGGAMLREERGPDLIERALIIVPQSRQIVEKSPQSVTGG